MAPCPAGTADHFVCISIDDTKALAKYLFQVNETRTALAACSLVTLVAQ